MHFDLLYLSTIKGMNIIMITYIYDNSFEGLLTSIYDSYYNKPAPGKIACKQEYVPDLLSETVHIKTDSSKSQKVYNAINCKISHDALIYVFYAYLSDSIGAANIIYKYVRLGFKLKRKLTCTFMTTELSPSMLYIERFPKKLTIWRVLPVLNV